MAYDIIISGVIGWNCTADYVRSVLARKAGQKVTVCINSLGGYVSDGLAIYQAIKDHGQVECRFVGMSASAATFLAMGAQSVTMAKNALILIHNSSMWAEVYGQFNKEEIDLLASSLSKDRQQLATIDEVIAQVYADRHGFSVESIAAAMKEAKWLKPLDAIALGLVDAIASEESVPKAAEPAANQLAAAGLPPLPQTEPRTAASEATQPEPHDQPLTPNPQPAMTQQPTTATVAAPVATVATPSNEADPETVRQLADKLAEAEQTIATLTTQLADAQEQVKKLQETAPADPGEPSQPEPTEDFAANLRAMLDF